MAYTAIDKQESFFNTKLYAGNGGTQSITGVGFQPDFTWIKNRSDTRKHNLYDSVRGVTKRLVSDSTAAEDTASNGLTAFGTDGFTTGSEQDTNHNGNNFVSWNWKAGTGQGSSNTDGSINTTYTSVNTTAGFSIVKWTGNGTAGATVGHGLGSAPKVVITKRTDGGTNNWVVGHGGIGFTEAIYLNLSNAKATDSGSWNNTAPSSTVFTVGSNNESNGNGYEFISYCFAEKTGYSKFGTYVGNANNDGTFVYTGFKPSWVMLKQASGSADDWGIYDTTRQPNNEMDTLIRPDTSAVEYDGGSGRALDILSNGFKLRTNNSTFNEGETYIYMAFGQSLVGSNNVPCTAR
jgi:hypothetical protein